MARDRIQLIAIAFLLAWCTVFGASYSVGEGWPALSSEMSWLFTAAATVAFAGALVGVRRLCDKAHEAASAQAANAQSSPSHKDLFIIAGIILCAGRPG